MTLHQIGLYTSAPRLRGEGADAALAQVEALGFDAMWVANTQDELTVLERALAATERLAIGTAVISIWSVSAPELATWWAAQPGRDRMRLGLGVAHAQFVPQYAKPLASLSAYVDILDAAGVGPQARYVGANGPKMLALAAARTAGALTYLVTPEQTAIHRDQLGAGAQLIPEVKVLLESDADLARAAARKHLAVYLGLENYLGNLRRMGFTESDLAAPGSDRLIDALVAHGGLDAALARVQAHLAAGADGVAIHVLAPEPFPVHAWGQLADALEVGR
ncbi:MAG: TIGR03620 family F420-dependent LLM class oxidoreductase [Sporichthyaceae bacterium]